MSKLEETVKVTLVKLVATIVVVTFIGAVIRIVSELM